MSNASENTLGMCGAMGEVIALFRLYRITDEEIWKEQAEAQLNAILNMCNKDTPFSYGYGICGIGAGIEWLIQQQFVDGNADKILMEVDAVVAKFIDSHTVTENSIQDGVLGVACYLYHRLCYRKNDETAIVLILKEYTLYLIDWLADILQDPAIKKDYSEFYYVFILLHQLEICNTKIERLLEWCDKELNKKISWRR